MKTNIKKQLSQYLGAADLDPKSKTYKEDRKAAYHKWYPKFLDLKHKAEQAEYTIIRNGQPIIKKGLSILEYFEKYHLTPKQIPIPIYPPEVPPIPLVEEEPEYPCPHCHKVYSNESILKRHLTMKHTEEATE